MGRVLFTEVKKEYVLDVEVPTEDGKVVKNIDLPEEDQIVATIELSSGSERSEYMRYETTSDSRSILKFRPEACAKKKCTEIKGLEGMSIHNGKDLAKVSRKYAEVYNICMAILSISCDVAKKTDDDEDQEDV